MKLILLKRPKTRLPLVIVEFCAQNTLKSSFMRVLFLKISDNSDSVKKGHGTGGV
jgi:hypothetical protein